MKIKKIRPAMIATAPMAPTAMPALAPVERPEAAGAGAGLVITGVGFMGEGGGVGAGTVLDGEALELVGPPPSTVLKVTTSVTSWPLSLV